ncbi:unnamed protein product [Rotaria sordida]|uniref:Uncharacterized protein n=1 Tax=Rotaria sordida TaxID=392033 RepID=A0A814S8J5_9BILA|nr:unnamed protein product [Rotaria sordida]
MGLYASPLHQGSFYLSTQSANQFPYCQHLYAVTLNVGNEKIQTTGRIQLTLQGSNQNSFSLLFDEQANMLLKANTVHTRVLSLDGSLPNVESVSISLKSTLSQMDQPIRQVVVFDIERQKSVTLCPTSDHHLKFELC